MNTNDEKNNNFSGLKNTLRSLRNRNYRLFFMGQGISLIGTWMQSIAMGWLIYTKTGSPFWLGIVGFSSQVPVFLAAPFGGVLADRWNKRKILLVTQSLSLLQALILTILVWTGVIQIWQIILLSVFLGSVNGFDMPTRQAFVIEMVDNEEDLPNAIALNSLIFNSARLIGPAIAGLLIEAVGMSLCFFLNAISFIPVIAAFVAMRIKPSGFPRQNGDVIAHLKDGIKYAYGFTPIKTVLTLLTFIGLVAMPYAVLMPAFAKDVLEGNAMTLGLLMGATGVGAAAGALFLASRKNVTKVGNFIGISLSIFAVAVFIFSMSRLLWFSMAMMVMAGFGLMVMIASINTVLQSVVDDDKRGRVMALYTMSFVGMAPLGSLLAGSIASIKFIGAPGTIMISGILCMVAAVLFIRKLPVIKQAIHPLYVRKGIIPQVASGLGSATTLTAETKE